MPRFLAPAAAVLAVVAALIAIELLSGSSGSGEARPAPPLPPDVLVPPRQTIATLRGKPALINFWASWCDPCRKEAPELERLSRSLRGRARLIGVDYTDNTSNARSFIRAHDLTYPMLSDPDGTYGNRYRFNGLPTTVLLDARGRIVQTLRGPQTTRSLEGALATVSSR